MNNIDPNATKYMIKAKLTADGVVEKPDVVGAIFGQTEGLLGDELDLRDLQKSGRIGRIEVDVVSKGGKSEGIVYVSSSLDQVETAILASALETIDRVGPCKAGIKTLGIEDVRVTKREQVVERAKELLNDLIKQSKGKSADLTDSIRQSIQVDEITSYGKDRCPAGPNVKDSESIIIVEGRSDVLNLLRAGIKNSIAVEGTNIPETVQDLSRERVATAFVDGDRGGELILRELFQVAEIDFVARAPRAHEVEELTSKQIVKCLRNKVPGDQYMEMNGLIPDNDDGEESQPRKERFESRSDSRSEQREPRGESRGDSRGESRGESRDNRGDRRVRDREDRDDDRRRDHGKDRDLRDRGERRKDRFNTDAVERFRKKEPADEEPAAVAEPVEAVATEPEEFNEEPAEEVTETRKRREPKERELREKKVRRSKKDEETESAEPADKEPSTESADNIADSESDNDDIPEKRPATRTGSRKRDAARQTKTLSPTQQKYRDMLLDMASTHNAKILNSNDEIIREAAVKSLVDSLKENSEGVSTIVFDGVISQRILDVSAEKGILTVVGTRKGNITKMPAGISIWTKEDLY